MLFITAVSQFHSQFDMSSELKAEMESTRKEKLGEQRDMDEGSKGEQNSQTNSRKEHSHVQACFIYPCTPFLPWTQVLGVSVYSLCKY